MNPKIPMPADTRTAYQRFGFTDECEHCGAHAEIEVVGRAVIYVKRYQAGQLDDVQ